MINWSVFVFFLFFLYFWGLLNVVVPWHTAVSRSLTLLWRNTVHIPSQPFGSTGLILYLSYFANPTFFKYGQLLEYSLKYLFAARECYANLLIRRLRPKLSLQCYPVIYRKALLLFTQSMQLKQIMTWERAALSRYATHCNHSYCAIVAQAGFLRLRIRRSYINCINCQRFTEERLIFWCCRQKLWR